MYKYLLLLIQILFTAHLLASDIGQHKWHIESMIPTQGTASDFNKQNAYLEFSGKQLSAYIGCNHINAQYQVNHQNITIKHVMSTLIGCSDHIDEQERLLQHILTSLTQISQQADQLILSGTHGKLILKRQMPNQHDGIAGKRWQYSGNDYKNISSSPLLSTNIYIEFANSEIGGFAGCNYFYANYQSNDDSINITSPAVTTRKLCPEDIMQQERNFLDWLGVSERYEIRDGQLYIHTGDERQLHFS